MSQRKTLLAASIIAGLCCLSSALHAQDTSQQTATQTSQTTEQQTEQARKANVKQLATVTVTGIRRRVH